MSAASGTRRQAVALSTGRTSAVEWAQQLAGSPVGSCAHFLFSSFLLFPITYYCISYFASSKKIAGPRTRPKPSDPAACWARSGRSTRLSKATGPVRGHPRRIEGNASRTRSNPPHPEQQRLPLTAAVAVSAHRALTRQPPPVQLSPCESASLPRQAQSPDWSTTMQPPPCRHH